MSELVNDVLELVFSYLDAKDIIACRQVCQRWKQVVDRLPAAVWRYLVGKDFGNECLNNRSSLTWSELYKSMSLWPKVDTAMLDNNVLYTKAQFFKILNNGVIAVVLGNFKLEIYNVIAYFDSKTMEEIDRETFDFKFKRYDENNSFVAVVRRDNTLCIIPKANKRLYVVGKMKKPHYFEGQEKYYNEFFLFDEKVYYRLSNRDFCVFQKKGDDYKTEVLYQFKEQIVSISKDEKHILCLYGQIFSVSGGESVSSLYENALKVLKRYKFDMSTKQVFQSVTNVSFERGGWYRETDTEAKLLTRRLGPVAEKILKATTFIHIEKNIVVREVHDKLIFSYLRKGPLDLQKLESNKIVDLNILAKSTDDQDHMSKSDSHMDLIYTENGFKIILCYYNNLYVLHFTYGPYDCSLKPSEVWNQCNLKTKSTVNKKRVSSTSASRRKKSKKE